MDNTRILRQEIEAYEREIDMFKSELSEKGRLVERERTKADEYQERCKVLETKNDELKRETERQRSDIDDYIHRLKTLTDVGQGRHHDDLALREKLQEKNRELVSLNDEYLVSRTENHFIS